LSQSSSPNAFQPQANASCPEFFIGPSEYYPQFNALVMKLDPTAHSIQGLTYLGAPLCLDGALVAVDSSGEPWIAGPSIGDLPPTANPLQIGIGYGFITKLSADFTHLLFSTYFDSIAGLALDSSGFAYVAGAGIATNDTQSVYIAEIDPTPAAISLNSVTSVAPPQPLTAFPGIAAGEVIQIIGSNMGPAASTPGVIQSGVLASNVAGVQVTFDGTAVPLLSVSAQEIDLVAPFELADKSATTMQVQYKGTLSNPVQVLVTSTVLQILGVFNEDFSPNSTSNPAKAGSPMSLYVAGIGQTNPPSRDGQVNATPPEAASMSIQLPADLSITFFGSAPGLAAGIFQVNFVAPPQSLINVNAGTGNNTAPFSVIVQ
jgi:uncharacterized protein (TIGR03437 family)